MDFSRAVHLDAAGAPMPSLELINVICQEMLSSNFGNPHSVGSSGGDASQSRADEARKLVLSHFCALPNEYDVIFTSGTTASINTVGQCFPWTQESTICYPMNVHTSLLGLRCYSHNVHVFPSSMLSSINDSDATFVNGDHAKKQPVYNLLLIPGECNFTGGKTNLSFIGKVSLMSGRNILDHLEAHTVAAGNSGGSCDGRWLWMLDAAKLAATSAVDLSALPKEQRPHFVAFSFYKIFGYPTGLGALLVRRDIAPLLQKR